MQSEARVAPSSAELAEGQDVRRHLGAALGELEERYAEVLRMRFFEGLEAREIGVRLNAPLETVRTRLKRGLSRLRAKLDLEYGEAAEGARRDRGQARSAWTSALFAHVLGEHPVPKVAPGLGMAGVGGLLSLWKLAALSVCLVAVGAILWPANASTGQEAALAHVGSTAPAAEHATTPPIKDPVTRLSVLAAEGAAALEPLSEPELLGQLEIQVRWMDSRAGVAGLQLLLERRVPDGKLIEAIPATTDEDGRAHYGSLRPGPWQLSSLHNLPETVVVLEGREVEHELLLAPALEGLHVKVVATKGVPVATAIVHMDWPGRRDLPIKLGTTDAQGLLELGPSVWTRSCAAAARSSPAKRCFLWKPPCPRPFCGLAVFQRNSSSLRARAWRTESHAGLQSALSSGGALPSRDRRRGRSLGLNMRLPPSESAPSITKHSPVM